MNPSIYHNGGLKVAKQHSNSKQLKAQDVYQLVGATLQEHFQLDMTNREFIAQDIWDVLIAASVERISIEMASQLLDGAPSGTTVRTLVKEMLQEERISAIIPGVNIPEQLEINVRGAYEKNKPKTAEEEQALRECRRNYYANLTPDYRWLHQWEYV